MDTACRCSRRLVVATAPVVSARASTVVAFAASLVIAMALGVAMHDTRAQPSAPGAPSTTPAPPSRGQLLYTTHCIACHSSQMHWRDRKLATDWSSLRAQVQRWQAQAQLGWSEADVTEVARYLNDTIYGYPQTSGRLSFGKALPAPPGREHSRSSRV